MDLDEIAAEIVIEIVIGMVGMIAAEAISMDLLIEVIEVGIEEAEVVQEMIGETLGIKMSHEVAVVVNIETQDTLVM
jgi:hypothetical protein